MPVSIIDHTTLFRGVVSEVFRVDRHGVDQIISISHPEHIAIKMDRKPFVWIETPRIHMFNTLVHLSIFRTKCRGTIHGSVNMEPQIFPFGNGADGFKII